MEKRAVRCPVCSVSHVPTNAGTSNGVYAGTCENCGYFFKFRSVAPYKSSISFTVNGKSYTVGNEYSVDTSLNDFLHSSRASVGTKVMCRQGGCGICIVEAKIQPTAGSAKMSVPVNSCLCPLFLCDGWEITTTEGLGSRKTGLHKIQEKLADYGGTQCGFCSPGQVMNMYSLTQRYTTLTAEQIEGSFEGNLCRCTGYRSILSAMKSHAGPQVDIEDLSRKLCIKGGKTCKSGGGGCGGHCSTSDNTTTDNRILRMVFENTQWEKATDYANLLTILGNNAGKKIRILGGNTGCGFAPDENVNNFDIAIDISGVQDFYTSNYDASIKTFTIGANRTLSELMDTFDNAYTLGANQIAMSECATYLRRVASWPIRSRATWAGNIMLKHKYGNFPSDVFNIMQVLRVALYTGPLPTDVVTPDTFLTTNMSSKVLSKLTFVDIPSSDVIRFYKIMPRSQNSLALVNAGFRCTVGSGSNFIVSGQPVISMGGISSSFHRANKTEQYLMGKTLSDQGVITGALTTLASEVVPDSTGGSSSAVYRKCLAQALLYKYFLHVLGNAAGSRFRSGALSLIESRPVSTGTQTYDTNKIEWPLNEPLRKLEADIQVSGEADYVDDMPVCPGQLYAAFVISTVASATIQSIDSSAALNVKGVFRVVTASDIPAGCDNNFFSNSIGIIMVPSSKEEILCSGQVHYCGQGIALVLADSQKIADYAATLVKVNYTNVQPPILTIEDAISKGSVHNLPIPDIKTGDAEAALKSSAHVTSGSVSSGEQYHFHMETQSTNCVPTPDGMEVYTTTQWTDICQQAIAHITGMKKSSITVHVKRLGGSFGGKITRNALVAGACGLAAVLTNRPVRCKLSLQTNMQLIGKRPAIRTDYQVGHDAAGKVNAIIVKYNIDYGYTANEQDALIVMAFADGPYYCPNWHMSARLLKTNKPTQIAVRAPGSTPASFFIETMMEHIAKNLNLDPTTVKTANLYKQGQVTPVNMTLNYCNIRAIVSQLRTSAQVDTRQQEIERYNRDNRWKKKGLSLVPIKYGLSHEAVTIGVLVSVYQDDGTVAVSHGGVEMGQGINTKVAQVCAYELGIPVTMVSVHATNSMISPNDLPTGGSVGSEICCQGVIKCCQAILRRMAPIKAKQTDKSWKNVVKKCYDSMIDLAERVQTSGLPMEFVYNSYGACVSEVELDILTGERQINRVDILFDCGESLNPAVDIGQIEGAFMMGTGFHSTELHMYNSSTGEQLCKDTWTYHPPTTKDIPCDFRIDLLKNAPNPAGVLRSKASGEPPLLLSSSVLFATKHAIEAARAETGDTAYFRTDTPLTVEASQLACKLTVSQFQI